MKLWPVVVLTALAVPVSAQLDTNAFRPRPSPLATQQLVQWWDSAAAMGFPDTLMACVYGQSTKVAPIVLDSVVVMDGPCPKSQLIGLLTFLDGAAISDSMRDVWFDEFDAFLQQSTDLWLVGAVHAVIQEQDVNGQWVRRPKSWASVRIPRER